MKSGFVSLIDLVGESEPDLPFAAAAARAALVSIETLVRAAALLVAQPVQRVPAGSVRAPDLAFAGFRSMDLGGEMLRLSFLEERRSTLGVLAMPCRQDNIRSDGPERDVDVLPSRRLGWLPLVMTEPVRLNRPLRLLNRDDLSHSSFCRFDHAQSCRKTLILPAKSAVTMILPFL
jgi:hypothetical protein